MDGERLSPAALLAKLNTLGGANGVGRVDLVEPLRGHEVPRRVRDPGRRSLCAAHQAVESLTMDREVMLQRDQLSPKIAQLIYNGFWYSPEMEALTAFVDKSQENVTGTARVRLYKGNCDIVGRRAGEPLRPPDQHLRGGRGGVQPVRRRRIHPAERPAAPRAEPRRLL